MLEDSNPYLIPPSTYNRVTVIIDFMTKNDFLRDKHNDQVVSGPYSGINSKISPHDASAISAFGYASGTAIAQRGGETGLLFCDPYHSAAMYPPGSMTATGYTNLFFIAQAYTDSAHGMGYDPQKASAQLASKFWTPTARK